MIKLWMIIGMLFMELLTGRIAYGHGESREVEVLPDRQIQQYVKVGVINNPPAESGYRELNVKDMERVFSTENGYELMTYYGLRNSDQVQAAETFIEAGVDYLLISASETTGWDEVLYSAKNAGIKVYLFDRMIDVDESLYEAVVMPDMQVEGEIAVEWLLSMDLPEYNVIHLQGAMGSDAQIGRTAALEKQFASGRMNKVVQQSASWDEAEAKRIVAAAIERGDAFNVIYAENDGMTKGAVEALDEANLTHGIGGEVIVISFDCNKWALREVLSGRWNLNVQCSPFQAQTIRDIIEGKRYASGKRVVVEDKAFDAATITLEDVNKYGLGE